MSRLCSMTLFGRPAGAGRMDVLLDLLGRTGWSVDVAGSVFGMTAGEEGFADEPVDVPLQGRDPFEVARETNTARNLRVIHASVTIENEVRHYSLHPHDDFLDIVLLGGRAALADGTTDFNWHCEHLVPMFHRVYLEVTGIEFSEHGR